MRQGESNQRSLQVRQKEFVTQTMTKVLASRHSEAIATAAPALLAEALRHSSCIRLRATGRSMWPTIKAGDVLLISGCAGSEVESGDVVLFSRQGRFFAHRVVEAGDGNPSCIVTRGDSQWQADPLVPAGGLLGRAVGIVRDGRVIGAPFPCSRLTRARGLVVTECVRLSRWVRALVRRSFDSRLQNPRQPIPPAAQ
jgi:signal peptidase I